jgi:hypothetical protein
MLVALAIALWWGHRPHPASPEPAPIVQSPDNIHATPAMNVGGPNIPGGPSSAIANPNGPVSDRARLPEIIQKYNQNHNGPVEFYGQVVDQDTNPLPGVKIDFSIQQTYSASSTEFAFSNNVIRLEKETSADGRVEITGELGDSVTVDAIQKEGYEEEPSVHSFGTSSGSFENPVIFKMWPTNIHEQLITGEKKFQIIPDGRPYFINLTQGTIAETGEADLKVWVKRPEQITSGSRYKWSCEMDVVNGGLLQETDANTAMYLAPTEGYIPAFQFEQEIGSGWGDSTGAKRFYVSLRNGQAYGQISIEFYSYYNDQIPGLIRIQYTINPSGSHILR